MRLFHRTIEAVARVLRVRSEVEGLVNLMPRVRITELLHEVNCVTGIASAFTNLTTGERFDDANALLAATPQGRPLFGIAAETPEEHCQGSGYVPGPLNLICQMLRSHRLRSFDQSRAYKWQDYRPAHRTVGEDARIARGQDHEDRRRNPD